MLVKINRRGRGGSDGPLNYLLGRNRDRAQAKILRGDESHVAALIDSADFAQRYTSGTLSFSESDSQKCVSEAQKRALMDEFEQCLFPGMDARQYSVLWVEHLDKDRLELNFLIPNIELTTGKRLQPYYHRADLNRVNAWQTWANAHYDYDDPHDPARARLATTTSLNQQTKLMKKRGITGRREDAKLIGESLTALVDAGLVRDRAGVIEALKNAGFTVTRDSNKSISVAVPNSAKPLRLTGVIYERDFRADAAFAGKYESAAERFRADRNGRAQAARGDYERAAATRREWLAQRYSAAKSAGTPAVEEPRGADDGRAGLVPENDRGADRAIGDVQRHTVAGIDHQFPARRSGGFSDTQIGAISALTGGILDGFKRVTAGTVTRITAAVAAVRGAIAGHTGPGRELERAANAANAAAAAQRFRLYRDTQHRQRVAACAAGQTRQNSVR